MCKTIKRLNNNLKKETESLSIEAQNNATRKIISTRKLIIRNRITSGSYIETEMKQFITKVNPENWHKRSTRESTTEQER